jgi:hypothetical protein
MERGGEEPSAAFRLSSERSIWLSGRSVHVGDPVEAGSPGAPPARLRVRAGARRHGLLLRAYAAAAALRAGGWPVQGRGGHPRRRLSGGDARGLAARRPARRAAGRQAGRVARPGADERGDTGFRLVLGHCGARRRPLRARGRRSVHMGRGAGVARERRPGGTPRRAARHRARLRGRRGALRTRGRVDREPGRHRARVLGRLGRRRGADAGVMRGPVTGPGRAAGTAGGVARAARPPGRHGHVAHGAGRHSLRRGRRARAAAAQPPWRQRDRDRGHVPVRCRARVSAVTGHRPVL